MTHYFTDNSDLKSEPIRFDYCFDNEEFMMDTTLGFLIIKGNGLEIIKLDTYQGNVSIKGQVDSLSYVDSALKKEKDNSFISKLFK